MTEKPNANNPFDTSVDLNPFAQVDVYNPFDTSKFVPESTPATYDPPVASPRATSPPPVRTTSFISPRPVANETPELKFRESDYDEVESFYRDETGLLENEGGEAPDSSGFVPPPPPMSTSRTTNNTRVSVHQSGSKGEDGELNFWQIDFYRKYFNVDSMDVFTRCMRSLWPFKFDFLLSIKNNPDFYGPFWISTTLIFMMAASANFAFYIQALIDPNVPKWVYDFYKLTYGSGVIYGYAFGIPLLFWLYIKWIDLGVSLIDILCIYGYSLFVYSPVALLCIIPIDWVKWMVVAVGCLFSTSFLIVNLWMPLREKLVHALIILATLSLLHVGLALTFRLYFFQYVSPQTITT